MLFICSCSFVILIVGEQVTVSGIFRLNLKHYPIDTPGFIV